MTRTLNRLGDRMLSALLPSAKASACVGDQAGYCVYRYTGCGGSQCYQYYQCGVGGQLISSRKGCC